MHSDHNIPQTWLKWKRDTMSNVGEWLEFLRLSYSVVRVYLSTPLEVVTEAKYMHSVWLSNPTPGSIPIESCAYIHQKIFTQRMFTAERLVIAYSRKLPKYPSTVGWINKLQYSHKMECYLAMLISELLLHVKTYMNLITIFSKRSNP